MKRCIYSLAVAFSVLATQAFAGVPNHLVISEMSIKGGLYISGYESPEFVEIYNPTASAVSDMSNYYLTDWSQYWRYPEDKRLGILPNEGTGDFVGQFPPSAPALPAGGVVTVTANAQQFLLTFFDDGTSPTDFDHLLSLYTSQPGNPKLYEMYDSLPQVPNMTNLNADPTSGSMNESHTDTGENVILFYYDGTSDLVKDVDQVFYKKKGAILGLDNGIYPKSGEEIDGPDADSSASAYLADSGSEDNLSALYDGASGPYQIVRRMKYEPGETSSGGNGITGDDTTLEQANVSFKGLDTTMTATAGIPDPGLTAADQKPVIYSPTVSPAVPGASQPITLSANIWDDGSVASATAYISDGVTTQSFPMTHGAGESWSATVASGYPNLTHLTWYVVATDNTSNVTSEWDYADYGYTGDPVINSFRVENNAPDGKVVINELMFDPNGGDNSSGAEFLELYNNGASSVDLSGDSYVYGTNTPYVLPPGTILAADDYLVITYNKALFISLYPGVNTAKVLEVVPSATASTMANSGTGTVSLLAFDGTVIDIVSYRVTTPWPGNTVSGSGYAASNTGYTIELVKPTLDNNDGANWITSSQPGGTPGADNFSLDAVRTPENPLPGQNVTINARLAGTHAATAGSVVLSYTINGGVPVSVTMTDLGSNMYTASLGTFAERDFISYNIAATDSVGGTNITASPTPYTFVVTAQSPITEDDIVINEFMPDPTGTDNVGGSEWVEYYNRRSTSINLGHALVGPDNANAVSIPEGFIVQPYSYFVLAGNKSLFLTQYPAVDPTIVIDAGWGASTLGQTGTPVRLAIIDPNQVMIDRTNFVADYVPYLIASPWPVPASNKSERLLEINLDNTVGANWVKSADAGTPGAQNTGSSSVSDWSMY